MTAERLAQLFHTTYERLAPVYGYKTRQGSAVEWDKVPEANKQLMIAVCAELLSSVKENCHCRRNGQDGPGDDVEGNDW